MLFLLSRYWIHKGFTLDELIFIKILKRDLRTKLRLYLFLYLREWVRIKLKLNGSREYQRGYRLLILLALIITLTEEYLIFAITRWILFKVWWWRAIRWGSLRPQVTEVHTHIYIILIFAWWVIGVWLPLQQLLQVMIRHSHLVITIEFLISLVHLLVILIVFLIVVSFAVVIIILFWTIWVKTRFGSLNWKDFIFIDKGGIIEGVLFLTIGVDVSIHSRLPFEVIDECTEILFILRVLEQDLGIVLNEVAGDLFVSFLS